MTDIAITFLIASLATVAYCIGYLHGQYATILQLAREIHERNSARKADWLSKQHRERDIA